MAEGAKVNIVSYLQNNGQAGANFEPATSYLVNVATVNGEQMGGANFTDAPFIPTDLLLHQTDDSGASEAMMQTVSTDIISQLQTQVTEQAPVQSNFFQSNALSSESLTFQSPFSSTDTDQDSQMMSFAENSGESGANFFENFLFGPSPVQQFTGVQSRNTSSINQDTGEEPNAAAEIGGDDSGVITEDVGAADDGILSTTGVLSISDVDDNESGFVADIIEGAYGIIIIDEDGNWDYEADGTQSVIQGLKEGETLTDSIEVKSLDGTTHTINVTIKGTNDAAVIGGDDSGVITEDVGADGDGILSTTGVLSISDVDNNESGFIADTIEGTYGTITIDENGNWRYEADGLQDTIQSLNEGESLTDSIEVTSLDGTKHTIDVTIEGTNDAAIITGEATGIVTEDSVFSSTKNFFLNESEGFSGWSSGSTTKTSAKDTTGEEHGEFLGQFDRADVLTKEVDISGAKDNFTFEFDFMEIDSWDNENFQLSLNGQEIVNDKFAHKSEDSGHSFIESQTAKAKTMFSKWEDQTHHYKLQFQKEGDQWELIGLDGEPTGIKFDDLDGVLHIEMTSTLNSYKSDESWGLDNVQIYSIDVESDITTSGTLFAHNSDGSEGAFIAESLEGEYGTLLIDETGNWQYTADGLQEEIQALGSDDTVMDSIDVTAHDGTKHTVNITIKGTNDAAVIGGEDTGVITEDVGADGDGILSTTGVLSISDVDNNESGFIAGTIEGTYGTFTIDEDGNWRYGADGLQDSIQALNTGDILTDNIEVASLDGTKHIINIIIEGADENAVLVGGAGNDLLITGEGDDVIDTGKGADKIVSGGGDDQINASADAVWKGYGALNVETGKIVSLKGKNAFHDIYDGGEGIDTLNLTNQSDVLFLDNSFSPFQDGNTSARIVNIEIINTGEGDDLIDLTSSKYSLDAIDIFGGIGNDTIWSSSGNDNLYGGQGDDYLYGGKGDDYILGDEKSEGASKISGADQLYGADGNDTLDGGAGADSLYGQSGDDTLWFDAEDNIIDGGSGTDTLMVDGDFDFSVLEGIIKNVEVIDLEGSSLLTIDSAFTKSVNGNDYTMTIEGDQAQEIIFEDAYVDSGITNIDGKDYNTYTYNDTTFHIDIDVTVTVPIV